MNWLILILAGLFEVGFTTCLGKAHSSSGTTLIWWMGGFVLCLFLSMALLFHASRTIPLGTAYAAWTGIGAIGTVLVGILLFNESTDPWRLFFIFMLVVSLVGLRMVSN